MNDPFTDCEPLNLMHLRPEPEVIVLNLLENQQAWDESYDFDQRAEEVAQKRGQVIVYPKPGQIQIDIDSEAQLAEVQRRIKRMYDMDVIPFKTGVISKSKTPGHYHMTVTIDDDGVSEWQRIALQAVLGSDPLREYLNCMRLLSGVEKPTRFFETPVPSDL